MTEDSTLLGRLSLSSVETPRPLDPCPEIGHVLFDFDGTLSLIRQGWPEVMVPMFVEVLPRRPDESDEALREMVLDDIMRLNGKQTIYQMIQLADRIRERGGEPNEPLWYKHEYLRRLERTSAPAPRGSPTDASSRTNCSSTAPEPCSSTCAASGCPSTWPAAPTSMPSSARPSCSTSPGTSTATSTAPSTTTSSSPRRWSSTASSASTGSPAGPALLRRRLRRDREHQAGRRPGRGRRQRRGP